MVVGGIVIMNIMLAAVTERTHEIGIRKSLGARRADILNQFLVESATLSAAGGLIGVLIAWAVAVIVRNAASIPMALPLASVAIGVGLSAVVGLFFGIYPAQASLEARSHRSPENGISLEYPGPLQRQLSRSSNHPCAQDARVPDRFGRRDGNGHHHRCRLHPDRLRLDHHFRTEELRPELDHDQQASAG